MAAARKPPGQRVRRNKVVVDTLTAPSPNVPALPLWAQGNVWALQWWEQAWQSPVSSRWEPCDHPALARLALLIGEVASGATNDAKKLSEIRALEDRFLLNPNSRRLAGVVLDDAKPAKEETKKAESPSRQERLKVV